MRSVVLANLPNTLYFIGTYDSDGWQDWWKSEPLPGQVAEIVQSLHAYGQYHLALCRMIDGTWSVYQSDNYGVRWYEVWNHSHEIYKLVRLDYGWLLAATADGWYETTIAGTSWAQVSTDAPGCKEATIVGVNVILAHDGRYIWRSTDHAHSWVKVVDCESYWTGGDIRPAIAGIYTSVLAGAGPYLIWSDDTGLNWSKVWTWHGIIFRSSYVHWEGISVQDQRVDQIVLAGVNDLGGANDINWIIRSHRLDEGIMRHHHFYSYTETGRIAIVAKFDQHVSPSLKPLTTYYIIEPNTGTVRRMVVSAQTHYNTKLERFEPSIKYSVDCGWGWIDLDCTSFTVYDGPDMDQEESSIGGPFLEENYTKMVYNGPPCHNSGSWQISDEAWQRGISFDMDVLYKTVQEINSSYPIDAVIVNRHTKSALADLLIRNWHDHAITAELMISKAFDRPYLGHVYIQAAIDKGLPINVVMVDRRTKTWLHDIICRKALEFTFTSDALVQGPVQMAYGAGMLLIDSHYDDVLVDVEKTFPQMWDIRAPHVPFEVEDTRRKEMTEEWP